MRVTNDEVKTIIMNYYGEHYPELNLTNNILKHLIPIVTDGLTAATSVTNIDQAMPSICAFLEKDNILKFVRDRQPCVDTIPKQVIEDLNKYFKDFLPNQTICHVYRKSNHQEDSYLYMVTAKNVDGTYSCWSSWNESLETLNHGHYGLPTEQDGIDILQELFNDITGEKEIYGMDKSSYESEHSTKNQETENASIISIKHKGR